ncbi:MAG: thioredoxin domain-containing protein [Rubripirellula sp.]|nr:thioredoxin domain-containing protein [Rubripirellula sp.]
MNRLADSLSPYLLQHKDNPVDWFPWGEEAFETARRQDCPIFLSVGYSACHWCHVMEHESFESEVIAKFLNDHFVSIKVDREERPDIDQIYMNAVQLMTHRGGWPMSVFLNHQLEPFYSGTYWPPTQKFGMPGFAQVLQSIADTWQNRRADVQTHASQIVTALKQMAVGVAEPSTTVPDQVIVQQATDHLVEAVDRRDGGFGGPPKFPHATDLDLLLRVGFANQEPSLIEAATLTLDRMACGGIYDHLGGGFARYSVDGKWLVPHFEKMLYDNALLCEVYVRAFQVTGNALYRDVACGIADYLIRDMVDAKGGFHSSEDADSEGVEGKYYVWSPAEVVQVLGQERGDRFCQIYDITPAGNFEGSSIPNLPLSLADCVERFEMEAEHLLNELRADREQLRQHRDTRVRPGRDDKVLASWNALAIKALAVAGGVFGREDYLEAAQRAATFITSDLLCEDGRLLHAFRQGKSHLNGFLDDYAYCVEAFIHLYESTGRARWIGHAIKLADQMLTRFQDIEQGGFFYTADDAESLITRNKDWHDGSLVSGNASAASGLLRLARLSGREDCQVAAERTFCAAAEVLTHQSGACGALLAALDRYWNGHQQLVLAVTDDTAMKALRPSLIGKLRPHATVSWVIGAAPTSGPVVALNEHRQPLDGKPTLYVCEQFACGKPILEQDLIDFLDD